MRNTLLVGMAIGAVIGAVLAEGNPKVSHMVSKGKQAVKQKLNELNQNMPVE